MKRPKRKKGGRYIAWMRGAFRRALVSRERPRLAPRSNLISVGSSDAAAGGG
jgi:hypothetical protein